MNKQRLMLMCVSLLAVWVLAACNPQGEEPANDAPPPPTIAATAVPVDTSEQSSSETVTEAVVEESVEAVSAAADADVDQSVEEEAVEVVEETTETEIVEDSPGAMGEWTADARLIPFDTFEFGYRMETTTSEGFNQFIDLKVRNSKPLSITLWIPTAGGLEDADMLSNMRMGVFENNSFLYAQGMGCIWSNEGAGNDEMLAFNTDSFLSFSSQPDAVFEGTETINGLETMVYTVGQETLATDIPVGTQIQEATGRFNLYELPTGELLIVRSELNMVSNYDMFGESFSDTPNVVTTFRSEISQINQPIDVQIPAECEQQAENFPYPIYSDGVIAASMPGMAILEVPGAAVSDVVAWYQAEMVNAGWTAGNVMEAGPLTNLDFTMDGRMVTVAIAQDPSTGNVAVTFIEG
ncbi:MAG: hypothetical protein AAGD96_27475 [Chloroflexota bacterium]